MSEPTSTPQPVGTISGVLPGQQIAFNYAGKSGAGARIWFESKFHPSNPDQQKDARAAQGGLPTFRVMIQLLRKDQAAEGTEFYFEAHHGGSQLTSADGSCQEVRGPKGKFRLHTNDRNEFSMIELEVVGKDFDQARYLADEAVSPFLDYASYLGKCSLRTGSMRVENLAERSAKFYSIGWETGAIYVPGPLRLRHSLLPIYGLYRDFKNSNNPFYRLICAYKVLEGILKELRPSLVKSANQQGRVLNIPNEFVPDHEWIDQSLRQHVGIKVTTFCYQIVREEYRNAASHFLLNSTAHVLDVGSLRNRDRFTDMAFLTGLCAEVVIKNHEAACDELERPSQN